jgi:sugar O-acyltransferase (sialic acid O-acetyltransferase NeuD family)
MKRISIIGSGGHTRSLINLLESGFIIDGIYDDTYDVNNKEMINGYHLVGKTNAITEDNTLVISAGDCEKRAFFYKKYKSQVLKKNLVHLTSKIEKWATIGEANQLFANTYLNSYVKIGDNNIINTGAIIEHETHIGNHNHISVKSVLCGRVIIGNKCFIGAGAIVINNISICDNVTIGAGSVVIGDIYKPGVYVGNPAMMIK